MYDATRFVDGDVLLVGDAGSFLDPLSSAGVKKALASGWLAAVAVLYWFRCIPWKRTEEEKLTEALEHQHIPAAVK